MIAEDGLDVVFAGDESLFEFRYTAARLLW